ncbi:hypothetical protein SAMN02745704_02764 [Paucidesulfovibrio gracilis DSM 16080]|uniref:Uncharacterized protein n=1 Tax=Paucidesulfovibrio gracilis DSM 16080 TaxID=1121449 RepID=A0A1T4Y5Y5_9BACT|nr:hypothetical protein [Paucidesulfovibrio gracilis]SKA96721.1 hypothetical protein SAMN02745704_02764 [Paucidesulfovibrio gracilis DSM 16080]
MKSEAYIEKCYKDAQKFAAVPVGVAADYLGITREAVSERIRKGNLHAITVKGKERNWRLVLVSALYRTQQKGEDMVSKNTERVRELLEEAARQQKVVFYGKLMDEIGLTYKNPKHRKIIGSILGLISEDTYADRGLGFMLSAIAVRKNSGLPNESFFELACSLKAKEKGKDDKQFWRNQRKRIFNHFG